MYAQEAGMSGSNGDGKRPIDLGQYNKDKLPALRRCERDIRRNPDDPRNWFNLSKILLDSGLNQEAQAALREALIRTPGSAHYRHYPGKDSGDHGILPVAMPSQSLERRASMSKDEKVSTNCDWCAKDIFYGNACVSINRNIEQMDSTEEYPEGEVTVIQSDTLLELCAECGNKLDTEIITNILLAIKPK